MDIIAFSKDWSEPKTSNNHVLEELAKRHRVLWVNSISTRAPNLASGNDLKKICRKIRSWFHGLQIIHDKLRVLTPIILPFPRSRHAQRFNRWLTTALVRRATHRWGFHQPQLWIFLPNAIDYVGQFSESKIIYYCVDEWSSFANIDADFIDKKEAELLKCADVVFVVSEKLYTTKAPHNANTHFIPHGVNHALFNHALADNCPVAPELQRFPAPIIGCLGNIYEYFDQEFVAATARLRPAWSFVIIGKTMTDVNLLHAQSNISILGPVPHERLPEFCKGMIAGFVAYKPDHPFSINCNPLKLREYLAAGLAVISTDIPAARKLNELVRVVSTPHEFVARIEQILATELPTHRLTRSQSMQTESWTMRVAEIERILAS